MHAGEDAVPSKVLEVMMNDGITSDILKGMQVQELTREHVASHLQVVLRSITPNIHNLSNSNNIYNLKSLFSLAS